MITQRTYVKYETYKIIRVLDSPRRKTPIDLEVEVGWLEWMAPVTLSETQLAVRQGAK